MILAQTTQHLFLIHDGARYHPSAATQAFLAAHRDRITAEPLPSYSPDYNPIEFLLKKTKQRRRTISTSRNSIALTVSVDKALAYFAPHPDTVSGSFGCDCEESGLEIKRAAKISKTKVNIYSWPFVGRATVYATSIRATSG